MDNINNSNNFVDLNTSINILTSVWLNQRIANASESVYADISSNNGCDDVSSHFKKFAEISNTNVDLLLQYIKSLDPSFPHQSYTYLSRYTLDGALDLAKKSAELLSSSVLGLEKNGDYVSAKIVQDILQHKKEQVEWLNTVDLSCNKKGDANLK